MIQPKDITRLVASTIETMTCDHVSQNFLTDTNEGLQVLNTLRMQGYSNYGLKQYRSGHWFVDDEVRGRMFIQPEKAIAAWILRLASERGYLKCSYDGLMNAITQDLHKQGEIGKGE